MPAEQTGSVNVTPGSSQSSLATASLPEPGWLKVRVAGGSTVSIPSSPYDGFWRVYDSGGWEPDSVAVFRRFIDSHHSYIDIGSWIGPTLLLGCQLAKRAYGIEPNPIAFATLSRNITCNRPLTDNVQLFELCVAPTSGKCSFGSREGGGGSMSSLLFSREETS